MGDPTSESEAPGYRCAAWRGGCTNRVAHPLEVCRDCEQVGAEQLEEQAGEPDDFEKDWLLAERGYEPEPVVVCPPKEGR